MKVIARWSNYPRGWEFILPDGAKAMTFKLSRAASDVALRNYITYRWGYSGFELEVIRTPESPNTPLD